MRVGLVTTTVYLDVLTVAAWWRRGRRRTTNLTAAPSHRFAVLIPAHDEQRLIATTVRSLVGQDYPAELFRVHVVADNCHDETARLASEAGAVVHERTDTVRPGKGPALQWLMARLDAAGERPDAFAFVDADTIVEPGFLRAVEAAMAAGASVVQGHYAVRDAGDSPVVAFRAAALAVRNYLRPLGRNAIGGSAGLYGNGMAFDADVMRRREWTDHLTEDVELHLELLLDGMLVTFAPDAEVRAEMPDTLAAAESQHQRWERGRLQLAASHVPTLLRRTVTGGPASRRAYADAALDQMIPPLSIVVAGTGAWAAAAAARAALVGRRRSHLRLVGSVVLGQVMTVMSALWFVRAPAAVYRSLLTAPRMIVWKLGLLTRVAGRPDRPRWTRTERN
jgi:1,2-diacylglycerol 3-beta-glucosyltransferase